MKKKKTAFGFFKISNRGNAVLNIHTHFIDRAAVANAFVSGIALYPQVFKVVLSYDFSGVSMVSFSVIFINNIIWSMYALHRGLISLLIASLLNVLATGILLLVFTLKNLA